MLIIRCRSLKLENGFPMPIYPHKVGSTTMIHKCIVLYVLLYLCLRPLLWKPKERIKSFFFFWSTYVVEEVVHVFQAFRSLVAWCPYYPSFFYAAPNSFFKAEMSAKQLVSQLFTLDNRIHDDTCVFFFGILAYIVYFYLKYRYRGPKTTSLNASNTTSKSIYRDERRSNRGIAFAATDDLRLPWNNGIVFGKQNWHLNAVVLL